MRRRSIRTIAGEDEFAEVFFVDVVVPLDQIVGEVDAGWKVATALLAEERLRIGSPALALKALRGCGGFSDRRRRWRALEARLVKRACAVLVEREDRCVDGSWLASSRPAPEVLAAAPRVLAGREGQAAWQAALATFRLTDAAYLFGLMATALAMSLDHLRLRRQFGVPIGSFQALQHRAADCHIAVAATRTLVFESARAAGTPRAAWAAAASVRRASSAALQVMRENIQFHGAIGFADEHDAGLCLRRAMSVAARHGDAMETLAGGPACAGQGVESPGAAQDRGRGTLESSTTEDTT